MLNEFDLQDFDRLPLRELYKCKPRSYVMVDDDVVYFSHVDGMYSYCKDLLGNTIHLVAWLEVIPLQPKTKTD